MKINRLFEIIYLLMHQKSITAGELAEHFEVSTRTILRDIDTLSAANIPIYTTQGKGGGISLMDSYVLNKSVLSEGEQEQILFALKSMSSVQNLDTASTLSKFEALFNRPDTDWIAFDFSHWGTPPAEEERLTIIKQALLSKNVLTFYYQGSNGQKSFRRVEPLRIIFKSHSWYLQGFCRDKDDYRLFKVSRIRSCTLLADTFVRERPSDFGFDMDCPPPHQLITVKLLFSPALAYRVYDEFDENRITVNQDKTLTATADYTYDEWIIGHVLSFGDQVKVLEPVFLREEICSRAQKIFELYQKDAL